MELLQVYAEPSALSTGAFMGSLILGILLVVYLIGTTAEWSMYSPKQKGIKAAVAIGLCLLLGILIKAGVETPKVNHYVYTATNPSAVEEKLAQGWVLTSTEQNLYTFVKEE